MHGLLLTALRGLGGAVYKSPFLCGFNVPIKGLNVSKESLGKISVTKFTGRVYSSCQSNSDNVLKKRLY